MQCAFEPVITINTNTLVTKLFCDSVNFHKYHEKIDQPALLC